MGRHYADACGARKRLLRRTRGVKAKTGSACVQTDRAVLSLPSTVDPRVRCEGHVLSRLFPEVLQ